MNKIILSLFSALVFTACAIDDTFTTEVLFDDGWHFVRIDGSLSEADSLSYISGVIPVEADTVLLPHTPRIEPLVVNDQWQGTCFYFKRFNVSKEDLSKRLALRFDAAMNVADVWVNGKHAQKHMGGYLPFEVQLNSFVSEGDNTVVVCLDNRDNAVTGPTPLSILDYNTYGGLYRHVWLLKNDRLMITRPTEGYSDAGVVFRTLNIDDDFANVFIQIDLRNISKLDCNLLLDIDILDEDDVVISQCQIDTILPAGERATLARVVEVDDVQLWSPESPSLYSLRITARDSEELLDIYNKRVGIRTLVVDGEGLYINGEKSFLTGSNRYQEYPYIGFALSDRAQWRDAWNIKCAGFNFVRCSHCPPSEAFLDACDAYGLLVLDAIPGWQFFGDKAFEAHALQTAKDLIRRDRNHPSVLAWELSIDEAYMPKSYIDAIAPVRDCEAFGTYTAGCADKGFDICLEPNPARHSADSQMPVIISRYGDLCTQTRESGHEYLLQQAEDIKMAHENNTNQPLVFADVYSTMYDHNRGFAIDLEHAGVADIFRIPKYAYNYFAAHGRKGEKFDLPHLSWPATDVTSSEPAVGVNVHMLEDGPLMPSLKEKKDVLIYYADVVDANGVLVDNTNSMVKWSISGNAYFVSPDQGFVQNILIQAVGGVSSVVVEKFGEFNVIAECVDNETVSE